MLKQAIAITGGYGCGKSTIGEILQKLGYKVVDSDTLAREVVSLGSQGLREVINQFGKQYLLPSGELDRRKLAELIFNDPNEREKLEAILHPLIRERWLEIYNAFSGELIFYLVPLYFESKITYPEISKSIVVYSSKENILKRSKLSADEVKKRLAAQLPISEKIKRADYLIKNDGDFAELELKVKEILKCL